MNQYSTIAGPFHAIHTPEEFGRAWRQHHPELMRRACRLAQGNPVLGEAFLARTTLRILEYLRSSDQPIDNFQAFFAVSLRNTAQDHWRRYRRDMSIMAELGFHHARAEDPDATLRRVIARQDLDTLCAALSRMSCDQARLVRLRVFESLPYGEIARRLQISEPLARKRMQVARNALRQQIEAGKSCLSRHEPGFAASIPAKAHQSLGGTHGQ